jgi:hypothetical protein
LTTIAGNPIADEIAWMTPPRVRALLYVGATTTGRIGSCGAPSVLASAAKLGTFRVMSNVAWGIANNPGVALPRTRGFSRITARLAAPRRASCATSSTRRPMITTGWSTSWH